MIDEKMITCSIMRLDLAHVDEICQDVKEQYESGIASYAMFMAQLVPEGKPPVNKAREVVEKYVVFRDKLRAMGLKSGILIQCSIGHGYPLTEVAPFTRYVNLNDGQEDYVYCPYDDDLGKHFKDAMKTLAQADPDLLMLDDDYRLVFRGGNGCACPLHMARFNELAGTDLTREELFEILKKDNDGEYAKIYIETQKEALVKTAKAMREGIDEVNPSLICALCGAGNNAEAVIEVSEILAGKGNPSIVRVSNGSYVPAGTRTLTRDFYRAALQIVHLDNRPKWVLAESDTCPQNRYACSAQWFHSHYVGTLLEGTSGAKHWLTRLSSYEPKSGVAYRKILAKNTKFYEAIAEYAPKLDWLGCKIPLRKEKRYFFSECGWTSNDDFAEGWATYALERLGLPVYFSAKAGGVAFLSGEVDKKYKDSEIPALLSAPVVMSSDVAQRLCARGFSKYLGVEIREWTGLLQSCEKIFATGQYCEEQKNGKELVPLYDSVEILSDVYNKVGDTYTKLFAGCTFYKNELGGSVVVFSGTPITAFNYVEGFSFMNYSRKEQLIQILKKFGCAPVYFPGDEEIYLKVANTQDGKLFCALFNFSYDIVEETELFVDRKVEKVEMLCEDGTLRACDFRQEGTSVTIEKSLLPLNPVILLLS